MKTIATLACRNNSKRLYGKPLQYLQERTVLAYLCDRIEEQEEIAEIVLAISECEGNEVYKSFADDRGIKYVVGDDKDVLGRLISACELAEGDTVFRVTSECPFIYWEGLPEAAKVYREENSDYVTFASLPDGANLELIRLSALKKSHEFGEDKHRSELCTLYIYENKDDFKMRILDVPKEIARPDYRLTIDFPEDLILCRKLAGHFGGDDKGIAVKDICNLLDGSEELRNLVADLTDESYVKPYYA